MENEGLSRRGIYIERQQRKRKGWGGGGGKGTK
jgi:hypothetical protein